MGFYPLYTVGNILRIGQSKYVEEWLNIVRIISLSQKEADYLKEIIQTYITITIQSDVQFVSSDSKLTLSFIFLSRLCVRFDERQVQDVLNLTIDLYKSLSFMKNYHNRENIYLLWEGIFRKISKDQLISNFDKLLSLPVINEDNFKIEDTASWKDPFYFIRFDKISGLTKNEQWNEAIQRLIKLVQDGQEIARKWAIYRLCRVDLLGLITDEERINFSKALWSRIDPENRLPDNSLLYKSFVLYYPNPFEEDTDYTKNIVKSYLLSYNWSNDISSKSFSGFDKEYLGNLINTTQSIAYINNNKEQLIDWNNDEVNRMFDKIYQEIIRIQDGLKSWKDNFEIVKDNSFDFVAVVNQLLMIIILPKFSYLEDTNKLRLKDIIEIFQSFDECCALTILPLTLLINPDSYEEVAQKLRKGLFDQDNKSAQYSLQGIYYWIMYEQLGILPKSPPDLFENLVSWVYILRQPNLKIALGYTNEIIKRFPDVLLDKNRQLENLLLALEYLIEATKTPQNWDDLDIQDPRSTIPNFDIPKYRQLSSQLSYTLYQLFQEKGLEMREILNRWKEQSQSDILTEVRSIWL
jgi:hypothetical protein